MAAPKAVLFTCGWNSIRSPMAAALLSWLYPSRFYVASAGVRAGERDPFAAAVMAEIGLDIAHHEPVALDDLGDLNFDLVVTLAPEAHHAALELTRTNAFDVEYWPTFDPTATLGNRDQVMDAYRELRDELNRRIRKRFARP